MNAPPVIAKAFELVSVTVSTDGEPAPTCAGLKLFATVGAAIAVSVSVAVLPAPMMEVTAFDRFT